jgi:hypothetical protein
MYSMCREILCRKFFFHGIKPLLSSYVLRLSLYCSHSHNITSITIDYLRCWSIFRLQNLSLVYDPIFPPFLITLLVQSTFSVVQISNWTKWIHLKKIVCSIWLSIMSRLTLGPTQPSIKWVLEALTLVVKWLGHEADHSPPSSAMVKNEWTLPPLPQCLHGVVLD